jgi:hypothetical protein
MKIICMLGALAITCGAAIAQNQERLERIRAARIALINDRLELTPEQAEKFWPLYNEYTQQRQDLLKEYQSMRQSSEGRQLTDEESKELLNKGIRLKEKQLDLDRTYNDRLTRVITNNQILLLRRAEEDFRKMIIERLDNRREQRERRENRKDNEQ